MTQEEFIAAREAKYADKEVTIIAVLNNHDMERLGNATFATADKYTEAAIEKYGAALARIYRRYEATHPTSPLYAKCIYTAN